MQATHYLGWDIGGAHLKAAAINPNGEIIAIYQHACPLWKGLATLHSAVGAIMQSLPKSDYRHAITMTGELVDLFAGRDDGVRQIIATMGELLPDADMLVFAGRHGLLPSNQITAAHFQDIASTNWLASAGFAAQMVGDGLFIDIGSTTTDILVLKNGRVQTQAYTDHQRLISKELVYTGIVRTAVMAVTQTAWDEGQEIGVMAEYFATMADVYRVTGELAEAHDQCDTADGAEKTIAASARRLARMIGCDFYPQELTRWQAFADNLKSQQVQKIRSACDHLERQKGGAETKPIIGAGIGRFLAQQLALEKSMPYLDFSGLCRNSAMTLLNPADCAPAVAVAYLNLAFTI
ncbi:MAG: hydantoinase/oxoprolinase family protein [Methylovulum sp.]|uniref:hydantoinase/oxoprolinase family protein n=1 Tax=Methylovulum sp. TaxID=1916980 RepID=UPI002618536A|nr:hydantoinase/oxoprolinase family protein [Methylovulum sp.]MDD2724550.1 hydantoinase/oxoprolinase family protein [Methylovulum sp.]MDD5123957.1 hydantoinase/oxoprolinase family protein [Methylovulum sp.]